MAFLNAAESNGATAAAADDGLVMTEEGDADATSNGNDDDEISSVSEVSQKGEK